MRATRNRLAHTGKPSQRWRIAYWCNIDCVWHTICTYDNAGLDLPVAEYLAALVDLVQALQKHTTNKLEAFQE